VEAGVAYYVYVNKVHDKAIVHEGSCGSCNDGRGKRNMKSTERVRDQWLGPFPTSDEALDRARQTGKSNVARCGACSDR
jgi:hypothetical protein